MAPISFVAWDVRRGQNLPPSEVENTLPGGDLAGLSPWPTSTPQMCRHLTLALCSTERGRSDIPSSTTENAKAEWINSPALTRIRRSADRT